MNEVLTTTLIALGTGGAGSLVTWFFSRKTERVKLNQDTITAIDMATDTWRKIVGSLKQQIEELVEENNKLREVVEGLASELESMRKIAQKVEKYEKRIKELESALDSSTRCNRQ